MSSSLIANALQVNFDSVLTFPKEGMVKIFKALESTGFRGFLGCPSVLYEQDLEHFFSTAFVRENEVISAVQGKFIGISEEQFARNGDQVIKASQGLYSLDLCFVEGCSKSNPGRGEDLPTTENSYSEDRCQGVPNLTLGEAKTFPPLKILIVKTVVKYVAKNKNITTDEDEPVEKVVKKAATKRRPAPAAVEPASKKKRTTVGRAAPAEMDLAMVPVVQNPEPISVVPAVTPRAQRLRAPKRKLVFQGESDDETIENIIKQVLTEIAEVEDVETYLEEPVVMKTAGTDPIETESRIDVSTITNYDEERSLKVLSNEERPLVETEKEKEK
ncbi:hypothetical protein F511_38257 [Dorcoceras hygrometricum]|uniref:Uncharacterized protein n=1 Tax=Dorcoceras hygrometricum TaxID=472368 RepID=A0A2Z7B0M9_9LAMI|nr:hypothetical protein F511_38257 [Dorcoceras hygrometricum]